MRIQISLGGHLPSLASFTSTQLLFSVQRCTESIQGIVCGSGPKLGQVNVFFAQEHIEEAKSFVRLRQEQSQSLTDAHGLVQGSPEKEFERQLRGVLGEWAVATVLGMHYVHTVNTFKAADLFLKDGTPIQVRGTFKPHGDLIIRPNARNEEVYVLTYLDLYQHFVLVRGWISAKQARAVAILRPDLVQDRANRGAPAIFLPECLLYPMEDFGHA